VFHLLRVALGAMSVKEAARVMRSSSEIVQQPDHHPLVIEHAFDVSEEQVDQGLHGYLPSIDVARLPTLATQCCSKFSS
jgi:hypothetical protein